MILYHFSNGKYNKLYPDLGTKRYLSSGKKTEKKVTLLTNNPNMYFDNDEGGNFFRYRYSIKLDHKDPSLHADVKFNNMLSNYNQTFGSKKGTFKWFFYENTLDYVSISEWDGNLSKFREE